MTDSNAASDASAIYLATARSRSRWPRNSPQYCRKVPLASNCDMDLSKNRAANLASQGFERTRADTIVLYLCWLSPLTMASRLFGLTIAITLLAPSPVHAQGLVFDTFRDYIESLRVQARIPGLAVAVIGRDQVLWEHAFGEQDIARAIAARTDTPFHLDGVTQVVTAALVLRCVEDGRLRLDDTTSQLRPNSPDADASIRELLSHTTVGIDGLQFAYRPERLDPLSDAVAACTGQSFRESVGTLLDRLGMPNSVPGPDVIHIDPVVDYVPPVERYSNVLLRLATPYSKDKEGRLAESSYGLTTLTASGGLISSVLDFAWFDLALRNGLLLHTDTLALAWSPPIGSNGLPLAHGLGWFVDTYADQPVVWQFGVGENASSSIVVTAPERGLTMVAMANSDGLATPLRLAAGGLTQSPFARLFLELFVR